VAELLVDEEATGLGGGSLGLKKTIEVFLFEKWHEFLKNVDICLVSELDTNL